MCPGSRSPPSVFRVSATAVLATLFHPLPGATRDLEIPDRFADPFTVGPGPLGRLAAGALMHELDAGFLASLLHGPGGGKMFGVLVVRRRDGALGYLRAFSGTLGGRWQVEGFAPPVHDESARAAIEPAGEREVTRLWQAAQALVPEGARDAEASLHVQHEAALAMLNAQHAESAAGRRQVNAADLPTQRLLRRAARRDRSERRRLQAEHIAQLAALRPEARAGRRLQALHRLRRIVCRALMRQIHDTYTLVNARGERRSLRSFWAPGAPPAGAGECAGPKLLMAAHAEGWQPVELAEFWWGAPPPGGGRRSGQFYPACTRNCGPLLPFLLQGVLLAEGTPFRPPVVLSELTIVHEDEDLIVVDKPVGLLSVPARDEAITDSVEARLAQRLPAVRPKVVHRLDMDTSGLLVACKGLEAYRRLQVAFTKRQVEKRYIAWVDGVVSGEQGRIELALRVDLDDRPRQIHDAVHGRNAVSDWRVTERGEARTRLELHPITGRTHQLRVHAAHAQGLGAPIVGDRLYGTPADRLYLHAEALAFAHPRTGARIAFHRPAPF